MTFLILVKDINWHFSTLKLSPIELNHKTSTSSFFWKVTQSVNNLIFLKNFEFPANIRNLESGITNLIPFTIKENNIRYSFPGCGTPEGTRTASDLHPKILTHWTLSDMYDLNQEIMSSPNPIL